MDPWPVGSSINVALLFANDMAPPVALAEAQFYDSRQHGTEFSCIFELSRHTNAYHGLNGFTDTF